MGRWRLSDHSLRHRTDIQRVFAQGRRRRSHHLTVFVLPRETELSCSRAALVVTRKVSRLAVRRNRLRRRLREAFRAITPLLAAPVDVIIIPQQAALRATQAELVGELTGAITGRSEVRPS